MSQTIKIYGNKSAATGLTDKTANYSTATLQDLYFKDFYVGFAIPSAYYPYEFESMSVSAYFTPKTTSKSKYYVGELWSGDSYWDESKITYNNFNAAGTRGEKRVISPIITSDGYVTFSNDGVWNVSYTGTEVCFEIEAYASAQNGNDCVYTTRASSEYQPYLTLVISDSKVHLNPSISPSSGYVPKTKSQTFNFGYTKSATSIGSVTATNYKFRYRSSSSASSYTEINCGTSTSYTVAANTFTTDAPQVQVVITDSGGTTTTSSWYTLSTVEATSTAICTSPKNTVIDGSAACKFEWQHIISTGTAPTKSVLQKSSDGSTWSTLQTVSSSNTYTTIAASTFSSGDWYWRVCTYNTDNAQGAWSDAVVFSAVASPATPSVTVANTPRPTVSWQSSEQQGYQIVVTDGSGNTVYDSNTVYGTSNSKKLPMYLDDGNYTFKVRVQNSYGLWSSYGTAGIVVANSTSATVTLTVTADDAEANLTWAASASFSSYLVYRNDVLIANVTNTKYKDLKACGSTVYKVRGIYSSSDYYAMSNSVTVSLLPSCLTISQDGSDEYIKLNLSTSQYSDVNISDSVSYVSTHIYGAVYPMLEMSSFKTKSISFNCAFEKSDERNAEFAAMVGTVVTVKTVDGSMVTGLLSSVTTKESQFYIAYSSSVSQIDDSTEVTI